MKKTYTTERNISKKLFEYKEEWNKFMRDETVDTEIIPEYILKSWKISKEYGVNPNVLKNNSIIYYGKKNQIPEESRQLIKYQVILKELADIAEENGFNFLFVDTNLKAIYFDSELHNLFQKPQIDEVLFMGSDCSEKIIGTSSMSVALRENRSVQLIAAQHYNQEFHNTHCSASPIYSEDGSKIGVLNLSSNNMSKIYESRILLDVLIEIFRIRLKEEKTLLRKNVLLINQLENESEDGYIMLDGNEDVVYYNKNAIKLLNISENGNLKSSLSQNIDKLKLNDFKYSQEQYIQIAGNNVKFKLIEFYGFEENTEKIIVISKVDKNQVTLKPKESEDGLLNFTNIVGKSIDIREAKNLGIQIAKTDLPILIFGETGTGKEMFAQSIHNSSNRREGPFVPINCGAIPLELVESELFGYESGAFTGALRTGKKGKIEVAEGGTLFLDEIESMPMSVQIKLLRALSSRKIVKVGGTKSISIDIRIVSATKKDLLKEADKDNFREDLYYRISTFILKLPPLRERTDDIEILLNHFIEEYRQRSNYCTGRYSKEFLEALKKYYWRGNVREFKNVIQRAVVLAGDKGKIDIDHLPDNIRSSYIYKNTKEKLVEILSEKKYSNALKIGEEIIIKDVLNTTDYNINQSAKLLGITRSTLYKKIQKNPCLINKKEL
ncbi:Transcriptional regulator containing PAS, AAA-type ATPase, and DNA-binding Fis domains [Dethiosulfatibacter aminovorans DSM 17477]|uniref:Transcriptional regulator containing PAS, AAA-type ATPase, and DNA-binding Fis domains n=2 Tax=Dethiosulfatibacter TaxID=448125 RepID=A0A1M6JNH4_9FIRM|nr:Transcriptional regulator containing PAS, AAA-type ATPase, and DNA-binding Fis domains [Dethiosulfatibacter aminovorans DSM 17477]